MKHKYLRLAACVALPLILGALSALAVKGGMEEYAMLEQPPLSPPGWLFPVAWSLLYVLMGAASYQIWESTTENRRGALVLYAVQLAVNFAWTIVFFRFRLIGPAVAVLVLLCVLAALTMAQFRKIRRSAGLLLLPYMLWLLFALYLNAGVWLLNP